MIIDSHFHIIDPRFPLVENHGYIPPPFTIDDYLDRVKLLGIVGGALVSGSFQAFDQTYLMHALRKLGPNFVGVTQLPASSSDAEIRKLDAAGIRAVRFNLFRGGSEILDNLERFAKRIHELVNWHVELYIDSKDLPDLAPILLRLPAFSIDHLGLFKGGFSHLVRLVEKGGHVKATGFGRGDLDIADAIATLNRANPHALMFGTDLPCTRTPRPFSNKDMTLIRSCLDAQAWDRIFYINAATFYRIGAIRTQPG